jgi:hypothetical protein
MRKEGAMAGTGPRNTCQYTRTPSRGLSLKKHTKFHAYHFGGLNVARILLQHTFYAANFNAWTPSDCCDVLQIL